MKKRVFSLLCAVLMVMSLSAVACAAETDARASAYFGATSVRAYAQSGGKVLFEIDVDATHTMQEVGASYVYVFEQQSDGSWDNVYTFTKESHPSLIWSNSTCAYVDAVYQGTVGKSYYALVGCYAKDSSGNETLYFNTNSVTAQLIVW